MPLIRLSEYVLLNTATDAVYSHDPAIPKVTIDRGGGAITVFTAEGSRPAAIWKALVREAERHANPGATGRSAIGTPVRVKATGEFGVIAEVNPPGFDYGVGGDGWMHRCNADDLQWVTRSATARIVEGPDPGEAAHQPGPVS